MWAQMDLNYAEARDMQCPIHILLVPTISSITMPTSNCHELSSPEDSGTHSATTEAAQKCHKSSGSKVQPSTSDCQEYPVGSF
jgi:hypothetical protein